MALQHIASINSSLDKLEWLTDDWVKEFAGKKAYKRARQLVASHTARQFAITSTSRGQKRIQCSSVIEGEDTRYIATAAIGKEGITESHCECEKKSPELWKCDHVAVLLLAASLFKNYFKKQPHWAKVRNEEAYDMQSLTEEQKAAGIGLPWAMRLYALTLGPDVEMPYDELEEEPSPPETELPIGAIPPPFTDMKQRRRRSAYSMNRKRALLKAASENVPAGSFGRWALDHFSPDLLSRLLDERRATIITKISQYISDDEMVAFECGMQDEMEDFDDRVDFQERAALDSIKAKKNNKAIVSEDDVEHSPPHE